MSGNQYELNLGANLSINPDFSKVKSEVDDLLSRIDAAGAEHGGRFGLPEGAVTPTTSGYGDLVKELQTQSDAAVRALRAVGTEAAAELQTMVERLDEAGRRLGAGLPGTAALTSVNSGVVAADALDSYKMAGDRGSRFLVELDQQLRAIQRARAEVAALPLDSHRGALEIVSQTGQRLQSLDRFKETGYYTSGSAPEGYERFRSYTRAIDDITRSLPWRPVAEDRFDAVAARMEKATGGRFPGVATDFSPEGISAYVAAIKEASLAIQELSKAGKISGKTSADAQDLLFTRYGYSRTIARNALGSDAGFEDLENPVGRATAGVRVTNDVIDPAYRQRLAAQSPQVAPYVEGLVDSYEHSSRARVLGQLSQAEKEILALAERELKAHSERLQYVEQSSSQMQRLASVDAQQVATELLDARRRASEAAKPVKDAEFGLSEAQNKHAVYNDLLAFGRKEGYDLSNLAVTKRDKFGKQDWIISGGLKPDGTGSDLAFPTPDTVPGTAGFKTKKEAQASLDRLNAVMRGELTAEEQAAQATLERAKAEQAAAQATAQAAEERARLLAEEITALRRTGPKEFTGRTVDQVTEDLRSSAAAVGYGAKTHLEDQLTHNMSNFEYGSSGQLAFLHSLELSGNYGISPDLDLSKQHEADQRLLQSREQSASVEAQAAQEKEQALAATKESAAAVKETAATDQQNAEKAQLEGRTRDQIIADLRADAARRGTTDALEAELKRVYAKATIARIPALDGATAARDELKTLHLLENRAANDPPYQGIPGRDELNGQHDADRQRLYEVEARLARGDEEAIASAAKEREAIDARAQAELKAAEAALKAAGVSMERVPGTYGDAFSADRKYWVGASLLPDGGRSYQLYRSAAKDEVKRSGEIYYTAPAEGESEFSPKRRYAPTPFDIYQFARPGDEKTPIPKGVKSGQPYLPVGEGVGSLEDIARLIAQERGAAASSASSAEQRAKAEAEAAVSAETIAAEEKKQAEVIPRSTAQIIQSIEARARASGKATQDLVGQALVDGPEPGQSLIQHLHDVEDYAGVRFKAGTELYSQGFFDQVDHAYRSPDYQGLDAPRDLSLAKQREADLAYHAEQTTSPATVAAAERTKLELAVNDVAASVETVGETLRVAAEGAGGGVGAPPPRRGGGGGAGDGGGELPPTGGGGPEDPWEQRRREAEQAAAEAFQTEAAEQRRLAEQYRGQYSEYAAVAEQNVAAVREVVQERREEAARIAADRAEEERVRREADRAETERIAAAARETEARRDERGRNVKEVLAGLADGSVTVNGDTWTVDDAKAAAADAARKKNEERQELQRELTKERGTVGTAQEIGKKYGIPELAGVSKQAITSGALSEETLELVAAVKAGVDAAKRRTEEIVKGLAYEQEVTEEQQQLAGEYAAAVRARKTFEKLVEEETLAETPGYFQNAGALAAQQSRNKVQIGLAEEEARKETLIEDTKALAQLTVAQQKRKVLEELYTERARARDQELDQSTAQLALERQRRAVREAEALAANPEYAGEAAALQVAKERIKVATQLEAESRVLPSDREATVRLAILKKQNAAALEEQLASNQAYIDANARLILARKQAAQNQAEAVAALSGRPVGGDAGGGGTLYQNIQAQIAQRAGRDPKSPLDFPTGGQAFASSALSSLRFVTSGYLVFGAIAGLRQMVDESAQLEQKLQLVQTQMNNIGEGQNFGRMKASILDLAASSGTAASEVAQIALQYQGAFGNTDRAIAETTAAVKFAKVAGLDLKTIVDQLTGAALSYDTTVQKIADTSLALQESSGVAAKETVTFISDVGEVAKESGLSLRELAAIGATASQRSGRSGQSIAESYARILPALSKSQVDIVQTLSEAPAITPKRLAQYTDVLNSGEYGKILPLLIQDFDKLSKAQQSYILQTLGSRREAQVLGLVLGNQDAYLRNLNATKNTAGKTDEYFAKVQATLANAIERLRVQFRLLGEALLRTGLSEGLQVVLGVAQSMLSVLADVIRAVAGVNEGLGGWPAKILIGLALFRQLAPFATAIGTAVTGGAINNTANRAISFFNPFASRVPGNVGYDAAKEAENKTAGATIEASAEAAASSITTAGQSVQSSGEAAATSITTAGEAFLAAVEEAGAAFASQVALGGPFSGGPPGWPTGTVASAGFPIVAGPPGWPEGAVASGAAVTGPPGWPEGTVASAGFPRTGPPGWPYGTVASAGAWSAPAAAETATGIESAIGPNTTVLQGTSLAGSLAALQVGGPAALLSAPFALPLALTAGFVAFSAYQSARARASAGAADAATKLQAMDERSLKEYIGKLQRDTLTAGEKPGQRQLLGGLLTVGSSATNLDLAQDELSRRRAEAETIPALERLRDLSRKNKQIDKIISDTISSTAYFINKKTGEIKLYNAEKYKRTDSEGLFGIFGKSTSIDTDAAARDLKLGKEWQNGGGFIGDNGKDADFAKIIKAAKDGDRYDRQQATALLLAIRNQVNADRKKQIDDALKSIGLDRKTVDINARLAKDAPTLERLAAGYEAGTVTGQQYGAKLQKDLAIASGLNLNDKASAEKFSTIQKEYYKVLNSQIDAQLEVIGQLIEDQGGGIQGRINQYESLLPQAADPDERYKIVKDILAAKKELANQTGKAQPLTEAERQALAYQYVAATPINTAVGQAMGVVARLVGVTATSLYEVIGNYVAGGMTILQSLKTVLVTQIAAAQQRLLTLSKQTDSVGTRKQIKSLTDQIAADQAFLTQVNQIPDPGSLKIGNSVLPDPKKGADAANAAKELRQAQFEYLKSLVADDPVKVAQIGVQEAQAAVAAAKDQTERLQALAQLNNAQRTYQKALFESATSWVTVFDAYFGKIGDTVAQARLGLQLAQLKLADAKNRGAGTAEVNQIQAEIINAEAKLRDADLQKREDDIDFFLQTKKISRQQAISMYQSLLDNSQVLGLNEKETRDLILKIQNLRKEVSQDLQFDVPQDIKLPTLYEVRRLLQAGGPGAYQASRLEGATGGSVVNDNRQYSIVLQAGSDVDMNKAIEKIRDVVDAPARIGTSTRNY